MTGTGWTGGQAPAEAPPMPLTEQLMAMRQQGPGDVLAVSLARAAAAEAREIRDQGQAVPDPDEVAANLVARGYMPGMISQLSQRLADTEAELTGEEARIEKAAQRAERTRQMHERGQIDAAGVAMRWRDTDEGDEGRVRVLERRRDSLQRQIREAAAAMAPQQERVTDPLEAATSRAHSAFVEATRAKMAAAEAGRPVVRPKSGSVSRGAAVPDEVTCPECAEVGATPEQSFLIHADPDAPAGLSLPATELTDADLAE